jgi:hypothetical protein
MKYSFPHVDDVNADGDVVVSTRKNTGTMANKNQKINEQILLIFMNFHKIISLE